MGYDTLPDQRRAWKEYQERSLKPISKGYELAFWANKAWLDAWVLGLAPKDNRTASEATLLGNPILYYKGGNEDFPWLAVCETKLGTVEAYRRRPWWRIIPKKEEN